MRPEPALLQGIRRYVVSIHGNSGSLNERAYHA